MSLSSSKAQGGFTLVEIAIVLVIIGLLLGGVLKGQEMIENSKAKAGVQDLNGLSAAYNSYIDRYRRTPGDDGPIATLTGRGNNWANAIAGNNNGALAVTAAQAFTGAGESAAFFSQLRASGFISGNPADAGVNALPRNPWGGLTGVFNNTTAVLNNLPGILVCMSQVPGKAAMAMEGQIDDGNPATGNMRATVGVAGNNTAPAGTAATYSEDAVYTLCRTI